ncbi:MAG: hypothetical protein N3A60_11720, partial [Thermanaerothrix sp.]|nr:hypothetical protein [Thermanaerothrix sp.]
PSIEANIKEEQKIIEEKMKEILIKMADALKREELELNDEEIFSFFAVGVVLPYRLYPREAGGGGDYSGGFTSHSGWAAHCGSPTRGVV